MILQGYCRRCDQTALTLPDGVTCQWCRCRIDEGRRLCEYGCGRVAANGHSRCSSCARHDRTAGVRRPTGRRPVTA